MQLASRIYEAHDLEAAVELCTRAGMPAVVFVHDFFEKAARAQAQALGMPDLVIYVYPQHKPGDYEADEVPKGVQAARELTNLLTRT